MTPNTQPWTEKHRPTTWKDYQGNGAAIGRIRKWIEGFPADPKPRLLIGGPGVGKTSAVQLIADKYDLTLVEVNASTARTTADVMETVKEMDSMAWDGSTKLIFLDEVDSWPHNVKLTALREQLKDAKSPIVLAANDPYNVPYPIKNLCKEEKITLQVKSRRSKLNAIAEAEGVDLSEEELGILADYPDLRGAINALQLYAESGAPLPRDDGEDREMGMFDAMDNILRGKRVVGRNINPEELVLWLQENLRKDYRGLEAGMAYDALRRADVYLQRARSYDYRYWKYAGELAERTADLRLTEPWGGYIKKSFPEWFRHKTLHAGDDSDVAALYRELRAEPGYVSDNYAAFRQHTLPLLRALSEEDRMGLIHDHRLSEDAMKALEVKPTTYQAWRVEAA